MSACPLTPLANDAHGAIDLFDLRRSNERDLIYGTLEYLFFLFLDWKRRIIVARRALEPLRSLSLSLSLSLRVEFSTSITSAMMEGKTQNKSIIDFTKH